jgi:hypothetical protein
MTLTMKDIQALADKLAAAPDLPVEKRLLTKKDVVAELRPAIESLKARGYNYEQIAELLTNSGLKISFGSLRQYMAERQGGRKKRTKATTADAQVTTSAKPTKSSATSALPKKTDGGTFTVKPDTDDI